MTQRLNDEQTRTWFRHAHRGFLTVMDDLNTERLGDPGLDDWDVRTLIGHITRSYLTIENYLGGSSADLLPSAAAYYSLVGSRRTDPQAIGDRARLAGQALGDKPVQAAVELAQRVSALVRRTPDDAVVQTKLGSMRLIDYLQTRAFEITVHTLDLCRALDIEPGTEEQQACEYAAHFAVELAASKGKAPQLVLALTGRGELPAGFGAL